MDSVSDQEVLNRTVVPEYDDSSLYSSAAVPDMMLKIRDDCEKLMISYNETADGRDWLRS